MAEMAPRLLLCQSGKGIRRPGEMKGSCEAQDRQAVVLDCDEDPQNGSGQTHETGFEECPWNGAAHKAGISVPASFPFTGLH